MKRAINSDIETARTGAGAFRGTPVAIVLAVLLALPFSGCGRNGTSVATPGAPLNTGLPASETPAGTPANATVDPDSGSGLKPGYYPLSGGMMNGLELDAESVAISFLEGSGAFLVLEAGGTGFINLYGEEEEIFWDGDSITNAAVGQAIPVTLSGDTVTVSGETSRLEFTLSSEKAPSRGVYTEDAKPIYWAVPEPGYYKLTGGYVNGSVMTAADISALEAEGRGTFAVLKEDYGGFINFFGEEKVIVYGAGSFMFLLDALRCEMHYSQKQEKLFLYIPGEKLEMYVFTASGETPPVRESADLKGDRQ